MSTTPWHNQRPVAWRLALVALIVAVGIALSVLPLKWAALLLVGAIAAVVALIQPALTLCLLPFAVPFGSLREIALGPVSVGGAEILMVALVATWLAQSVVRRRIVIPHGPLLLPLTLFLGVLLLSLLPSASLELSAKEIVKWIEVIVIYALVSQAADERLGRWVVWALLAAATCEAVVGIYQFLGRVGPEGFVLFGRFMRAYGHFAQPNPFAGYLGLSFPLSYALSMQSWSSFARFLRRPSFALLPAVLPVVATGIAGVAIAMSWSRGAWVGLACSAGVVTLLRSRRAVVTVAIIVLFVTSGLALGGARYIPASLVQRGADLIPFLSGIDVAHAEVNDANWAILERMAHWQAATGMISDHPWLGVGIGNYPVAYPQYAIGRWRDPLGHAHNYYLNIAAEAGLVGLGAYLILVVACFVATLHVIRRTRESSWWRAVALGVMGVLTHLSVHNLFDNLYVHSMNVQLGLVLGLLVLADRYGRREPGPSGNLTPGKV
jgi:O-antigen ligase